eukprot:363608-Chlamydomonas_euryale.AAC.2
MHVRAVVGLPAGKPAVWRPRVGGSGPIQPAVWLEVVNGDGPIQPAVWHEVVGGDGLIQPATWLEVATHTVCMDSGSRARFCGCKAYAAPAVGLVPPQLSTRPPPKLHPPIRLPSRPQRKARVQAAERSAAQCSVHDASAARESLQQRLNAGASSGASSGGMPACPAAQWSAAAQPDGSSGSPATLQRRRPLTGARHPMRVSHTTFVPQRMLLACPLFISLAWPLACSSSNKAPSSSRSPGRSPVQAPTRRPPHLARLPARLFKLQQRALLISLAWPLACSSSNKAPSSSRSPARSPVQAPTRRPPHLARLPARLFELQQGALLILLACPPPVQAQQDTKHTPGFYNTCAHPPGARPPGVRTWRSQELPYFKASAYPPPHHHTHTLLLFLLRWLSGRNSFHIFCRQMPKMVQSPPSTRPRPGSTALPLTACTLERVSKHWPLLPRRVLDRVIRPAC